MNRSSKRPNSKVSHLQSKSAKYLIGALLLVASCLVIFSTYTPSHLESGPSINSHLKPFSAMAQGEVQKVDQIVFPHWEEEVWTPIDLDVSSDSFVVLCRLDYKKYWENPHSYPMFRDLVAMSGCHGKNRRRERMSVLLKEIEKERQAGSPKGRVVSPTGFVFHESRVGSTLVANLLASDPWTLVFSESAPMANAILHCDSCTTEMQLQLFRDIATLMGRSPYHKRLFFKFQSATTMKIMTALKVSNRSTLNTI